MTMQAARGVFLCHMNTNGIDISGKEGGIVLEIKTKISDALSQRIYQLCMGVVYDLNFLFSTYELF